MKYKTFTPYYIYVDSETSTYKTTNYDDDSDEDTTRSIASSPLIASSIESHSGDMIDIPLQKLSLSGSSCDAQNLQFEKMTKGVKETYEKSKPAHGDEYFFNFSEYISKSRHQILRYSMTRTLHHAIPFNEKANDDLKRTKLTTIKCSHCGSGCKFEIQLLPNLANELLENENCEWGREFLPGIGLFDFSSVYIFTCENNCWNDDDEFRIEPEPIYAIDKLK